MSKYAQLAQVMEEADSKAPQFWHLQYDLFDLI
jgi:hypothetical protein